MDGKKIGMRIKAARTAKGLTQTELAHAAGLTAKYVSNIECGSKLPKFETFVALANALDADANSLLVDVLAVSPQIVAGGVSDKLALLSDEDRERLLRLFDAMIDTTLNS